MSDSSEPTGKPTRPLLSGFAICCALLAAGVVWFLETPQGREFNEDVFGRFYTLGAIMVLAFYGALTFGLLTLGVAATVWAWRRGEPALWRWLALLAYLPPALFALGMIFAGCLRDRRRRCSRAAPVPKQRGVTVLSPPKRSSGIVCGGSSTRCRARPHPAREVCGRRAVRIAQRAAVCATRA